MIICVTKTDEGSENGVANTLRGTLLLRMANSWTLAKHRVHHPEGSLPSSLANRYFDYQKTKRAGLEPPREAARSFNSLKFAFEIWERESAPAYYCLVCRLFMDLGSPSRPAKYLVVDEPRLCKQTTRYMAPLGCQSSECSL